MPLYLTVASAGPGGCAYREFDIDSAEGLTGPVLALALDSAMGASGSRWFVGAERLDALAELPADGHLYVQRQARVMHQGEANAPVWLLVDEGPDAGAARPLTRGIHTLGRGPCDVKVADPAMSRQHAQLVVDTTSITLLDEGSVNGSRVGGETVRNRRLAAGDTFQLGRSVFRIAAPGQPPAGVSWPLEPLVVDGAPSGSRPWLMLLGAVLPLGIGIALALALGSWYFLAFSALGVVTGGVPALADLRSRRRYSRRLRNAVQRDVGRAEDAAPTLGAIAAALRLSGGRGEQPAAAPAHGPEGLLLRLGRGTGRPLVVPDGARTRRVDPPDRAPVLVELRPGTVGAIAGPPTAAAGLLRAVVLQLASVAASGGPELWIAGPSGALPAALRRIRGVRYLRSPEELAAASAGRRAFVVVLVPCPNATWIEAASGPGSAPALVLVDPDRSFLPAWRMDLAGSTVMEHDGERPVRADRMSFGTLAGLAGRLADRSPISEHVGNDRPPRGCAFQGPPAPWTGSSAASLATPIGRTGTGELTFDLVRDGPHLLVAGTTGSGKSEFLKSLLLGLVCRYEPAELSLMLVDFKGGSTLGPFARLPHCQSLVTDLHAESASRTLEALRAELLRREQLLERAGVGDYAGYRSSGTMEPLPRLLVMVDEFRVLTDEVPAALAELVRLAAVGRSLGLHLVLATQRPQGAVSAEMRANINATACLRLLSTFDSTDLLGTDAAARIPATRPGSGLLKRGNEAPVAFQAVHAGPTTANWTMVDTGPALGAYGTTTTLGSGGRTPSAMEMAEDLMAPAKARELPRNPFAPPLPDSLTCVPRRVGQEQPPGSVPWGLLDLIDEQRLAGLWWDPCTHRRTAVASGPAAGGVQAIEALAAGLLRREPECHLYLLDGGLALGSLSGAPRTAAHVGPAEPERVEEVFELLERPTAVSAADRVLIVTGLAAWASALGGAGFVSFDDRLAALARSAESLKLAVVVIGDRDLASSRFFSLAENRVYCPHGLGPETVLTWPQLTPVRPVPGRAVWLAPGTGPRGQAAQLLSPVPADSRDYPAAAAPLAASRPLPRDVDPNLLDQPATDGCRDNALAAVRGTYALGITGPDNRPWHWRPGRVALVLGRPGTGKTTALRRVVDCAGFPAVFWSSADPDPCRVEAPAAESADEPVPQLVVVDDAAELGPAERLLLERWHAAGADVVMSAVPSPRLFTELPLAAMAREPDAALLLNPRSAADADFLGWRIKPHRDNIPGRGYAMVDGDLRSVQVACAKRAVGQDSEA